MDIDTHYRYTSKTLHKCADIEDVGPPDLHGKRFSALLWMLIFQAVCSLSDCQQSPIPRINFITKTFTACKIKLAECPHSDSDKYKRTICLLGFQNDTCPEGTFYGCGNDPKNGFTIEGCLENNICPPGSSNRIQFDINTRKVKLICPQCDSEHYQSHFVESNTESLNGCSEKRYTDRLKNELHTLVLVEKGWPLKPDKYSCNVSHCYSDTNGHMYCYVNTLCHCTKDMVCPDKDKPDLLPDGSCDKRCETGRDALNNFTCPRYAIQGSGNKTENKTQQQKTGDGPQTAIIVVVVAVAAVGVIVVIVVVVRKTHCRIPCMGYDEDNVPGPTSIPLIAIHGATVDPTPNRTQPQGATAEPPTDPVSIPLIAIHGATVDPTPNRTQPQGATAEPPTDPVRIQSLGAIREPPLDLDSNNSSTNSENVGIEGNAQRQNIEPINVITTNTTTGEHVFNILDATNVVIHQYKEPIPINDQPGRDHQDDSDALLTKPIQEQGSPKPDSYTQIESDGIVDEKIEMTELKVPYSVNDVTLPDTENTSPKETYEDSSSNDGNTSIPSIDEFSKS